MSHQALIWALASIHYRQVMSTPLPVLLPDLPSKPRLRSPTPRRKKASARVVRKGRRMTTKGRETDYPGITQMGPNKFRVLATQKVQGRKPIQRTAVVHGTIHEAVQRRLDLFEGIKRDLKAGLAGSSNTTTIANLVKIWMEYRTKNGQGKKNSNDRFQEHLDDFILPCLGPKPIGDLRPKDIAGWQTEFLSGALKKDKRLYATDTLHGAWRTLRAFVNWAFVYLELPRNPIQGLKFQARGGPKRQKDVLDKEELHRLLNVLEGKPMDLQLAVWLMASTGMRVGEITSLRWPCIDLGKRVIYVRSSQNKQQEGGPKNKRHREVPMAAEVHRLLLAWKQGQERGRFQVWEDVVIPSQAKSFRDPSAYTKPFRLLEKEAGLTKHISPHCFRRTANNLVRKATDAVVARDLLGHVSESMTATYSHVDVEEKAAAVNLAILSGLGSRVGHPSVLDLRVGPPLKPVAAAGAE